MKTIKIQKEIIYNNKNKKEKENRSIWAWAQLLSSGPVITLSYKCPATESLSLFIRVTSLMPAFLVSSSLLQVYNSSAIFSLKKLYDGLESESPNFFFFYDYDSSVFYNNDLWHFSSVTT